MNSNKSNGQNKSGIDEDEIFKSLSHVIRRSIIKILGDKKDISFTEIKNQIANVDSPTLAYHIKSLKHLIEQKDQLYYLTDLGKSALNLMKNIDQTDRMKKNKKRFMIANIITICCWALIQFSVPFYISTITDDPRIKNISWILNIIPQINYVLIWRLWGKSWKQNN